MMKDKELLALHEKRLRRILEVALSEGCDTIILGAFGCGAFQNNPEVVALANRNVIKDYLHAFKNIEFARKKLRCDSILILKVPQERNVTIFQNDYNIDCIKKRNADKIGIPEKWDREGICHRRRTEDVRILLHHHFS